MSHPNWLSSGQAARRIGVSQVYVLSLINKGRLLAERNALGYYEIEPQSLAAYITHREQRAVEREQKRNERRAQQRGHPHQETQPQEYSGPAPLAERRAGRNGGVHSPMIRSRARSGTARDANASNGHDGASLWATAPTSAVSATGTTGRSV